MTIGERRRDKALHERQQYVTGLLELVAGRTVLDSPCQLRPGERALLVLDKVGLFEPRSTGGSWAGHSRGVSIPMGDTRMRLRVGQSRGHYVRAPEEPTVIDQGAATITDRRIVFQGSRRVQEWQLAKLVGFLHDEKGAMTAIQVSNRQKVSGIRYPGVDPERVHLVLDVAAAISEGQEEQAVSELRGMLPPPPPSPTATPAGWFPDRTADGQLRYWDGTAWTQHTAPG